MGTNHQFNDLYLHIGKELTNIRIARNEKQINVANAIGMSAGTISQIENGRYPYLSVEQLLKLASYYKINASNLFPNTADSTCP